MHVEEGDHQNRELLCNNHDEKKLPLQLLGQQQQRAPSTSTSPSPPPLSSSTSSSPQRNKKRPRSTTSSPPTTIAAASHSAPATVPIAAQRTSLRRFAVWGLVAALALCMGCLALAAYETQRDTAHYSVTTVSGARHWLESFSVSSSPPSSNWLWKQQGTKQISSRHVDKLRRRQKRRRQKENRYIKKRSSLDNTKGSRKKGEGKRIVDRRPRSFSESYRKLRPGEDEDSRDKEEDEEDAHDAEYQAAYSMRSRHSGSNSKSRKKYKNYYTHLSDLLFCLMMALGWTVWMLSSFVRSDFYKFSSDAVLIHGHVLQVARVEDTLLTDMPTYCAVIDYMVPTRITTMNCASPLGAHYADDEEEAIQIRKQFITTQPLESGFANVELLVLPQEPTRCVLRDDWEKEVQEHADDECWRTPWFKRLSMTLALVLVLASITGGIQVVIRLHPAQRGMGWALICLGVPLLLPAAIAVHKVLMYLQQSLDSTTQRGVIIRGASSANTVMGGTIAGAGSTIAANVYEFCIVDTVDCCNENTVSPPTPNAAAQGAYGVGGGAAGHEFRSVKTALSEQAGCYFIRLQDNRLNRSAAAAAGLGKSNDQMDGLPLIGAAAVAAAANANGNGSDQTSLSTVSSLSSREHSDSSNRSSSNAGGGSGFGGIGGFGMGMFPGVGLTSGGRGDNQHTLPQHVMMMMSPFSYPSEDDSIVAVTPGHRSPTEVEEKSQASPPVSSSSPASTNPPFRANSPTATSDPSARAKSPSSTSPLSTTTKSPNSTYHSAVGSCTIVGSSGSGDAMVPVETILSLNDQEKKDLTIV